ncbi:transcriptional regulator, LytTR family [Kandleria vitulina]|uniref:Transcriptional regulator, LytTR family n=1 Tax=Kandleria vitulina TaxID=1630 RepID=A0A1H2PY38_9FIRM|nr:LytTR family DNA-binding domain-containing protein [Kandleria vitulina]MEE0989314.1 LytTR family DNA-binding domain-containing protein [Kandleria vitulina]SDV99793.1 transcriptional regulator, LytTR family [Kandleria vitulina]HAD23502.1 LytTR family transcriptional regulator [Kandleria vitulina]
MKVNVELSKQYHPPYIVIYTDEINDEVQQVIDMFTSPNPLVASKEGRMHVLKVDEIYMITVEDGKTIIYTYNDKYVSKKRLKSFDKLLGKGFMQISKQTIINLSYLDLIEASFNGAFLLKLKNGLSDYVSRKYFPQLKEYLGL